ncbi:MAG: DMT family transporter [Gemmatimonadota bacterium]
MGLLSLSLIWGVNFPVIKVALAELHPLAFNALRFPLAALVLFVLVRRRRRPGPPIRKEDWPLLFALGILGNIGYQLLFIFGLDATLAGNAAILLATTPVWTTLFSTVLGHERPPLATWLGIFATLGGMVLVVGGGSRAIGFEEQALTGDVMMIAAAVVWSAYTVGGRDLTRRYGALRVTGWTLWVGTAGLVAIGIPHLTRTELSEVSPLAWAGVAYAGVFALGVAYTLWYNGVRRLGSTTTALYSNLVPVVALVAAWLWLGERPSLVQLVGAAAIIAGITAARVYRPAPAVPALPPTE